MNPIKLTFFCVCVACLLVAGCGVNRQAKELRALEKCQYEIVSVDSVYVAGTSLRQLTDGNRLNISSLPGIALGFLTREIPIAGLLNVRVTNPTNQLAGIRQFTYKIAIEGQGVVDGTSDLPVRIPAGETIVVPVKLQANIFSFLSDQETLGKVISLLENAYAGRNTEPVSLTIQIKPTVALGNKEINYPGYINIDKKVDAGLLFKRVL